jgi:hypothetical protein
MIVLALDAARFCENISVVCIRCLELRKADLQKQIPCDLTSGTNRAMMSASSKRKRDALRTLF